MFSQHNACLSIGVFAVGLCSACHAVLNEDFTEDPIFCSVAREECIARTNGSCTSFVGASFSAQTCTNGERTLVDSCRRAFCSQTDDLSYKSATCQISSARKATTTDFPNGLTGLCTTDTASTHQALVTFTQRFRACNPSGNVPCATLSEPAIEPPTPSTVCMDLSEKTAIASAQPTVLLPPNLTFPQISNPSVRIAAIQRNNPNCGLTATENVASKQQGLGSSTYALGAGNIGSVSAAGTTATLAATHGTVLTTLVCGDGICQNRFEQLSIGLADMIVQGQAITAVNIQSTQPAPVSIVYGHGEISSGDLNLRVSGRVNGAPKMFGIRNKTALIADFGQTMRLAGSFDLVTEDAQGAELPISTTIDFTAPKATSQQQSCAGTPATQRIFGFEDRERWDAPAATLTQVSSPTTEGCGALGIAGQNYMYIYGPF